MLDTPQTITVITAETMKEQGTSTLVQALKNTPGISMLAGEGGTGGAPGDSATIRGFNARKDIFIDGVRDFGSYARDPFNLEQVEIVKGPSSFLGGRGSTGGAINLVTKQAQRENFYAGAVSGGTDAYKRLTLDVNQSLESVDRRLKDAAFRINAVGFEANTPGRDYVKNERIGIAPTLTFGLGSADPGHGRLLPPRPGQPARLRHSVRAASPTTPSRASPATATRWRRSTYSNFYGLVDRDHENVYTNIGYVNVRHDFGNGIVLNNRTQYGLTSATRSCRRRASSTR